MNPLFRRVARLERNRGDGGVMVVSQFVGMTKETAMQLRFGPDGPPDGARIVLLANALPPEGVAYDWATNEPGTAEYEAVWTRLSLEPAR
jgi:hypothetical protein